MADEDDKNSEKEKDPLSFFAAGDDSSTSDSEDDEYDSKQHVSQDENNEKYDSNDSKASKLPSPQTLFATVGRPSFLNKTQEQTTVDWDKLSTKYNPAIYTAAPVVSLEEREKDDTYSDAMISSNPVKYGKELSDIQKHIVIHGKRGTDIRLMSHRESSEKDPGESSAKKAKTVTFQQKEKRKRDIGQATSDKSYVEEEKRILREGFSAE